MHNVLLQKILDRGDYELSFTNISNESLVEQVLSALQKRMRLNGATFDMIIKVLNTISGMEYLARNLEDRLRYLLQKQSNQESKEKVHARKAKQ